jgi:hypothetical protein
LQRYRHHGPKDADVDNGIKAIIQSPAPDVPELRGKIATAYEKFTEPSG